MEQAGAGPLADEALRKLIRIQLQKYEKQLAAVLRELGPLERQHGMSSEECHRRFVAGEIGDAAISSPFIRTVASYSFVIAGFPFPVSGFPFSSTPGQPLATPRRRASGGSRRMLPLATAGV